MKNTIFQFFLSNSVFEVRDFGVTGKVVTMWSGGYKFKFWKQSSIKMQDKVVYENFSERTLQIEHAEMTHLFVQTEHALNLKHFLFFCLHYTPLDGLKLY